MRTFFLLFGKGVGKEGRGGWLEEGYVSVYWVGVVGVGVTIDHGRRATHQGNHNCLRNNVHDDYTIF